MYLILHAFSRRNSGDGLLVDLTMEALEAAGIARQDCALLALDPESFPEAETVYRAPGEPAARVSPRLARAGVELACDLLTAGRMGTVAKLAAKADGMIAVGGGYLVADSPVRQLGVLLNHIVQMSTAARADVPTIYLPQSIGPLRGPVGTMALKRLHKIDRLYVRDDLTLAEVGHDNTRRVGDLAVLKLAREIKRINPIAPQDKVILVARDLPNPGTYLEGLEGLTKILPTKPLWAVQADTEGPRSDRAFYQRLGHQDCGAFVDLLASDAPGVVVSVRLHGAIGALLNGRPAIHLAYERKGWGAYEDLGLAPYVHDVRDFDPDAVAAQVRELQADPAPFWDRISAAAPVLEAQYADLVTDLRARLIG